MIYRFVIACLFAVSTLAISQPAHAVSVKTAGRTISPTVRSRAAHRQAIRRLPIQMRPDRPGHFYGNTVRRIQRQRVSGG